MNPVAGLLARLSREGISLAVEGSHLAASPAAKVTPELREEILSHRADLMELARLHGSRLLDLFRDLPSWPPPRGRSGALADPDAIFWAIGRPVSLRDGRGGTLRAVLYDTRSGRLRCCLEIAGSVSLTVDPDEVLAFVGSAVAVAEGG